MQETIPFKIAALPDLMARAAMFAITSGRASNIINKTPIGQLTLSRLRPSSKRVRSVTLPTFHPSRISLVLLKWMYIAY